MQTETVTRQRGVATTDPYSGEATGIDWSTPTTLAITTLALAEPRPSQEPVQNARNAVTTGYTLYLPTGSDVTAADRMVVRGETYDVLGEPAEWASAGIVVQVGNTEG